MLNAVACEGDNGPLQRLYLANSGSGRSVVIQAVEHVIYSSGIETMPIAITSEGGGFMRRK
jgi:hypothetical protein